MSVSNPPMPQLVELDGPHEGRVHPLPYGLVVLGRGAQADVALEHEDVSRQHASLEVGPKGVLVRDTDSKNGVWTQGLRIGEATLLGHDDHFSLGKLSLRVVHPATQVTRALAAGGETTVTTDRPPPESRSDRRALLVPLLGVLFFGAMVAFMLLR